MLVLILVSGGLTSLLDRNLALKFVESDLTWQLFRVFIVAFR